MLTLNDWFLSLPVGRQKILLEDKWMLAQAAFEYGYKRGCEEQKERDACILVSK